MNITEHKYFIHSLKGILKERVDFSKLAWTYGNPKMVSNNGRFFIFKKSQSHFLNIMMLTLEKGLKFIKSINICTAIESYIEARLTSDLGPEERTRFEQLQDSLSNGMFQNLKDPKECRFLYCINDNMDVTVQVMPFKSVIN